MKKNISTLIAMIAPGVLGLLMERRGLSLNEASDIFYNSQLYKALEDETTKLWRLSYLALYDMLREECLTGRITFPEEQM